MTGNKDVILSWQSPRFLVSAVIVLALLLGVWFGIKFNNPQPVMAQENGRWILQSGRYGQSSFYVVKLNTVTGDALVLSAERGA